MKIRRIATGALTASVALSAQSPISAPVRADGKDFVAGAIIGGLIGGAVANENNKRKVVRSTRSTKTKSTKSSSSTETARAEPRGSGRSLLRPFRAACPV